MNYPQRYDKPNPNFRRGSASESDIWREYESRKTVIKNKGLSPDEYAAEIRKLTNELGI